MKLHEPVILKSASVLTRLRGIRAGDQGRIIHQCSSNGQPIDFWVVEFVDAEGYFKGLVTGSSAKFSEVSA